jgi:hypothetical protein
VDAVLKNTAIIVLPAWWKALWYLDRLSPALSAKVWSRTFERLRVELEAGGAKFVPRAPEDPLAN